MRLQEEESELIKCSSSRVTRRVPVPFVLATPVRLLRVVDCVLVKINALHILHDDLRVSHLTPVVHEYLGMITKRFNSMNHLKKHN